MFLKVLLRICIFVFQRKKSQPKVEPYSLPKPFYRVFLCSLYVGFVPVSDLLDISSSIWGGVFSLKFLFVTEPNQNLVGEFLEAPDLPKHEVFLELPKYLPKHCNAAGVV